MTTYCNPKVGIGVFVFKGNKILLGKRKGSHGAGEWSLPGGHLKAGESFEDCCKREVFEETGIKIKKVSFIDLTNDLFPEEGLHYVTLFFITEVNSNTKAKLMEPEKCEGWRWVEFESYQEDKWLKPLFSPLEKILSEAGGSTPIRYLSWG